MQKGCRHLVLDVLSVLLLLLRIRQVAKDPLMNER